MNGSTNGQVQTAGLQAADLGDGNNAVPAADIVAAPESGVYLWFAGLAGAASLSDDDAIDGYDSGTAGFAVGVQAEGDGITIGGGIGYAYTDVNGDDTDLDVQSILPAVYGKFQSDAWYISAIVAGAYNFDIDQTRHNHSAGEDLDADYDGGQAAGRLELGMDIGMDVATFTPFIAGALGYLWTDGYDESGGATALTVDNMNDPYAYVEAGARAKIDAGPAAVSVMAGWREYVDDAEADVDASFAGLQAFNSTYDVGLSGLIAGVNVDVDTTDALSIGAGVNGTFGEDYTDVSGNLNFKYKF